MRHAKALSVLVKYKALFVSELMALSGIEKHEIHQTLSELQRAKMVSFNGEKFVVKDAAESMHRLLEMVPATETSKVVVRNGKVFKAVQRVKRFS